MRFELLPVLTTQAELYAMPRGMERFRAYIQAMTGGGDDIAVPLVSMNPLGKEHNAALIATLQGFGAEAVAAAALEAANARLAHVPGALRVSLVVTDDAQGGWTNRFFADMALRFQLGPQLRRGWCVVPIWTSEPWDAAVRVAALAGAARAAYALRHGTPLTLGAMLDQEAFALNFADAPGPLLEAEDLAYTAEVLRPLRDSTAYPTQLAALYGDAAARAVGYPPLGLSQNAGYALARAAGRADPRPAREIV